MSYLILAYPALKSADYDRVQAIRQASDPLYFDVVKPHVTLVFGTDKMNAQQLTEHAQHKLAGFRSFPILLDSVKVVEDDSKKFFHTFLVPSQGYQEIITLHDLLYTNGLAGELRLDIPFIPHVGIGTNTSKDNMNKLADGLTSKGIAIQGMIEKLSIVEYDGHRVVDLKELSLEQ